MHNNYYFLRQLSQALQAKLRGFRVVTCFSQEKDELVIGLTNGAEDFYIKAMLSPHFSTLTFPATFNRARANSVNLFPEVTDLEVLDVIQHVQERSFYLALAEGYALLFKMFGNRANVVLFRGDEALSVFQKKFHRDLDLQLSQMGREIEPDQEQFLAEQPPLSRLYPTWGDLPRAYLEEHGYGTASPGEQWAMLEQTRHQLENPSYYLIQYHDQVRLSLLPLGQIRQTFADPILALQEFVRTYQTESTFEKNYQQVSQSLEKRLSGGRKYLEELEYKIMELAEDQSFSQTADLIMANLTRIPPNAREVEVFDFYHDQPTTLKLPEKESPQKYAERLYKKNKNRQIESRFLAERVAKKQEELAHLEKLRQELASIQTNRDLKQFMKAHLFLVQKPQEEVQLPYRRFETEGFKILVGKNAAANDRLTQQHTFKEDLWLHAKDVAGSHVVVKYQAGKNFPETVIEKAAQLAAWYSRRKNDSLCPVLYTPKKYVRKPKGAEPGAVVVEREKVILVKPENPFDQ